MFFFKYWNYLFVFDASIVIGHVIITSQFYLSIDVVLFRLRTCLSFDLIRD